MAHKAVCKAVARIVLALASIVVSSGCRVDPAKDLVRMCETHLAVPNVRWQPQQRREYLDTFQQALHQGTNRGPDYSRRMDILRASLPLYWTSLTKGDCSQAQFDVHKTTIRWYIETLLSEPLASDADKELLKRQFRNLCGWAAEHLQGQFPFLAQAPIQEAKSAALSRFDAQIETPLLPVFRRPFTDEQMQQIKVNWARGYLRWQAIWQGVQDEDLGQEICFPKDHPHYRFIARCLANLPQAIWPTLEGPPDYARQTYIALNKEKAEESRINTQIRKAERDLMTRNCNRIEQVEQWGFVFSALFEPSNPLSASQP